jgi:hypothetical protein
MAEDFNHIDQIIRQKFENFEPEPPVQVWEKIRSGIQKDPPPPPAMSTGFILPIIIAVSLLIFIGGLIHHFYPGISNDPETDPSALTIQTASVISTGSTTISDPSLQNEFYQTPSEAPSNVVSSVTEKPVNQEPVPVRAPFGNTKKGNRKKNSSTDENSLAANSQPAQGQWKPGLVQAVKAGELSYADAVKYDLDARTFRKLSGFTDDYARKNRSDWSIGLYFNPEVTSCQDQNIENTISYNVGILPRISFNHLFIQSGVNMRFTHDKGNLAVDYNRFLGTYEHVDYMTFDTVDNVVVPTYHTHTQDVFDTVNHYSVTETKVNYTYLEVPLYFGYRYSFGKLSVFGKAGPAASFLMSRNLPDAETPEENARIIEVNYEGTVRYDINWQLLMGAGFDYQLAEKINFSFEPTFRLGLKPEYKLSEGVKGSTRSFGLRLGLNYSF